MSCSGHSADTPTAPVQPAPVATVTVEGIVPLKVGATAQLHAVPHDASGNPLSGRVVSWNSTLPGVASVSDAGMLTGIAPGSALITATVEGKNGTGSVFVSSSVVVATVSLGYPRITMASREVLQVEVTARDAAGNVLLGRVPTWTSSDPTNVAVHGDGSLTAGSAGSATVTASVDGISASAPVTVIAFASITAGSRDTCALTSAGLMYCAGMRFGPRAKPVSPEIRWSQLDEYGENEGSTLSHLCGVTTDSKVMCWGSNETGELGVGDRVDRDVATLVTIPEGVTQISAGTSHTCALTVGGSIYCWGADSFGQLGDGDVVDKTTPVRVMGSEKFTQVSSGFGHTCALTTQGAVLCWGRNVLGELGRGTWSDTDAFPTPIPVLSNFQFKSVSVKRSHSCAVALDGRAYCWGANTVYELGQTSTTLCSGDHPCLTSPSPVTGNLTFEKLAASVFGGCGLTSAGTVHCWGFDSQSVLGAAPGSVPACPVSGSARGCTSNPLPGPIDFKTVTGSERNYCGIRFDGGAYCWGGNSRGQLGNPALDESAVPQVMAIDPTVIPP